MRKLAAISFMFFASACFAELEEGSGPYYAFYHFYAPDPAAVVTALDKFWKSDCGQHYPADAGLNQEVFNGGYDSTHFIITTFRSAQDQQDAAKILRSCETALEFLAELNSAGVLPITQYIGGAPIDANDWGQDSVFTKYDLVVEPQNEAAYVAAFAKMTNTLSAETDVRSYGLGAIGYGRDRFTHWVWFGARTIAEMDEINRQIANHPAAAEFNETVGEIRTIVNTTQVQTLKVYPRNK